MPIIIQKGDFLKADDNLLVHQVNCKGVMGSCKATLSTNVAHQIRQKWPEVYNQYKQTCEYYNVKDLLGKIQNIVVLNDNEEVAEVINMFAQLNYGNNGDLYTSYDAFDTCIYKVAHYAKEKGMLSVAMPYGIGCKRGGASWDEIYNILNKYFGAEDQPYLTLYQK